MVQHRGCPICGGNDTAKEYTGKPARIEWRNDNTFDVYGCATCTHKFINPVLDDGELAWYYGSQYSAYQAGHGTGDLGSATEKAHTEKHFRHVDLTTDMDVIDIGCGSGSFLKVVQSVVRSIQG